MRKITFVLIFIFFTINISLSQTWSPLGSGISGPYPVINTLIVYNNELIAGGQFTSAGGVSANNIAKWNGTSWSPLGSGTNTPVLALTIYNNDLIAGGNFTLAGGIAASYVTKWNGTNWAPLGSGTSSPVYALKVYNNDLIVGGTFIGAGGAGAKYVAKWNGTSWSPLGSGVEGSPSYPNPSVLSFEIFHYSLIAGGCFQSAGGLYANHIAGWNGSNWTSLGGGPGPSISCQVVYNTLLYAGGQFLTIGRGTGGTWTTFASGLNGYTKSLLVINNDLYAAGAFTTIAGVSADRVARWNGTNWSPLGSGISGGLAPFVNAMTVFNNGLIVGGDFTTAGGVSANYIARWELGTGIKQLNQNIPSGCELKQNYPNPFNPNTIMRFKIKESGFVTLKVYNNSGKEIETLVNEKHSAGEYEVNWDASAYPSGIYFYELTAGDFKEVKKMMLVK